MRCAAALVLFAVLLLAAPPAAAWLAPVGHETVAAAGAPERLAIAATADGGVVIAWSDAVSRRVRVRVYDGAGRPRGHAQTLGVRGEAPAVAVGADGRALVAWRQHAGVGSALVARRVDPDGLPRGEVLHLAEASPLIDSAPLLAVATDGRFAAAWSESGAAGATRALLLRRFASDGTPLGAVLAVDGGAPAARRLGGLAAVDGGWLVTWEERPPGAASGGGAWQRTFAATGGAASPPRRLDEGAAEPAGGPAVARLGDGWVSAWSAVGGAGGEREARVVTGRFAADGEPETPPLAVARTPGSRPAGPPALAALADGGWLVAWREPSAAGDRLVARAFAADGTPAGDAFEVAAAIAGEPVATALAGGGAALAWRAPGPAGGADELRLRRLESPCVGDAATLCLGDGRFRARVTYADPFGGHGDGVALPRGARWGSFWFFRPSNVELAVKVLDARKLGGNFWVFYASLTNVAFTLTVVDVETGNRRVYDNPGGTLASRGDTAALPGGGPAARAPAARRSAPARRRAGGDPPDLRPTLVALPEADPGAGCEPAPDRLCLGAGGRFAVEATWHDFGRGQGAAGVLPQTSDTGALWFFRPGNPELIVKVLDGRAVNGSFWVFYGALTNVAFDLVVRDTVTGRAVHYENPLGTFASRGDTGAFPQ